MANNPYVNKVQLADGRTLMDITDTTAEASDVASGKYFYNASGAKVLGTSSGGGGGNEILYVKNVNDVLDKTWQEIIDAMQSKVVVVAEVLSNDRVYLNPVRDVSVRQGEYIVSLSPDEYGGYAVYSTNSANGYPEYDEDHSILTVSDVQVNGTSVVSSGGVAEIDISGKIDAPSSPATGSFLVYNGSAWVAQTLSTWQGGNY